MWIIFLLSIQGGNLLIGSIPTELGNNILLQTIDFGKKVDQIKLMIQKLLSNNLNDFSYFFLERRKHIKWCNPFRTRRNYWIRNHRLGYVKNVEKNFKVFVIVLKIEYSLSWKETIYSMGRFPVRLDKLPL